jgi:putative PIG3 family NAD(P)H quinone oxidoreductase
MAKDSDMFAMGLKGFGGPEQFTTERRPIPTPEPGEVLIRVAAAGVNRPDLLQRMGKYPPPPGASDILGLEVAGTIVAVGLDAEGWREGDRVCALLAGGGYAQFATAPAGQCLPVPDGLTLAEAASLPETAFTVFHNVVENGHFQPGQTVLVHGGTSGIGVMAIQMVTALGGRAIATAGSAHKAKACLDLGAIEAVNYTEQDFVKVVRLATDGRGADVILDMVGGDYLPRNMDAAAVGGRIVQIAFLRGAKAQIDLATLMQKRLVLTGSTLRTRDLATKARIAAQVRQQVWPLIGSGAIRPLIDSVFPLTQAAEAHRRMESSAHIGKIVLTLDD